MRLSHLAFTLALGFAATHTAVAGSTSTARGQLYDFNFVGTDFRAVFDAIGKQAGVDILPSPKIEGKLTLNVRQKSWQETVEIICNLNNFAYTIENRYVHVLPKEEYQKRALESATKEVEIDKVAPRVERIFYLKNSKVSDMTQVVTGLLSPQGRLSSVERNNALVVYDAEKYLNKIDSVITALDVETKQILISAQLLVVDASKLREIGVNWSTQTGFGTPATGSGTGAAAGLAGTQTTSGSTNGPMPVGTGGVLNPRATNLTFGFLSGQVGLAVSSLLNESKNELLARPQITTMDHTPADIFMGEKRSIRVVDDKGISSNQLVDAGIRLLAVPHVTGDNRIMLEIRPENNSFGTDGNGGLVINTQQAATKVVVDDGETVVIAGLTRNQETETETGVPVLKDIPVLGYLFKWNKKEIVKKDLIIFVTPQIIDPKRRLPVESAATK